MRIRKATRRDLTEIGRVADAAYWASYGALIGPAAIEELIRSESSPSSLKRRLLSGGVLVAEDVEGRVIGFADSGVVEDHVELFAITTDPEHRRRGVGCALVRAVRDGRPDLPICADVMLGNLEAEGFYESMGFAPGEVIQRRLKAEPVVARRWWHSPT